MYRPGERAVHLCLIGNYTAFFDTEHDGVGVAIANAAYRDPHGRAQIFCCVHHGFDGSRGGTEGFQDQQIDTLINQNLTLGPKMGGHGLDVEFGEPPVGTDRSRHDDRVCARRPVALLTGNAHREPVPVLEVRGQSAALHRLAGCGKAVGGDDIRASIDIAPMDLTDEIGTLGERAG